VTEAFGRAVHRPGRRGIELYAKEPGYDDPDGASIIDPDGKVQSGFIRLPPTVRQWLKRDIGETNGGSKPGAAPYIGEEP
jgi:hypothetical protein